VEAAEPNRIEPTVAAAQRLRIDYATAEVLEAFERAGVPSILLKGPSIVRWLYDPGESRMYIDCDLLVAPADYDAAGAVLTSLAFEAELEDAEMPAWWREHGVSWQRESDRAAVDLHRTLSGVDADPQHVWEALSRTTEPVDVAGFTARALCKPALAFHVALHAAQHGGSGRQADELRRALERADEDTWRAAADLARELDALDAFSAGLSFVPAGAELAERLQLASGASTEVALRAAGTVDGTLTIERFLHSGAATRVSMLRYKLAPPPTFMRKWSPLARRSRLGLALAYVWRPICVVTQAPQALRDWRAARKPS
jgi:hypothetical protein